MPEITKIQPLGANGKPSGAVLKVMREADAIPAFRVSLLIPEHFAGVGLNLDLRSAEMLCLALQSGILEARRESGVLAPMPADGAPMVAGWADIEEIVGMADFEGLGREAEGLKAIGATEAAAILDDALAALVAVREIARRDGVFERKGGPK